ncbi:MAG TPA: DinB family protein [Terriglobales bacterium]|nr:DinB family protein [Terriglobales bacterium]
MKPVLDPMLSEFREEATTTRRVLERVPKDKLAWKPHAKSMSLGQLANHIAMVPGRLAHITQGQSFDVTQGNFVPPQPKDMHEIWAAFEQSVKDVEAHLQKMSEEESKEKWRLMHGDKQIFERPRVEVMRSIMLNHWYHHRGQMSVYLRLLDVPVPIIYGRSADESPFE